MQRFLILVLAGVILVTTAVLWWGFFLKAPASPATSGPLVPRRVEIDTSVLSSPVFQELDEPREKAQIPPEVGRDNPFLPSP